MCRPLFRIASAVVFTAIAALPLFADTLTVTQTVDSGPGSLRQALTDADANPGPDTVVFNIPVSDPGFNAAVGVWTIQPQTALPELTDDGTTIDGGTQAVFIGADTNPLGPEIELDGSSVGAENGLAIASSGNTVHGLVINRFAAFGINIYNSLATYNTVTGCYIGTDPTGTIAQGNGFSGIILYNGAADCTIGGATATHRNVVSGNGWSGVEIQAWDTDNNVVIGNHIGVNATGNAALGNDREGVNIWSGAAGNRIGGANPGESNVISANQWAGVSLGGAGTDLNVLHGNLIGTDATGTVLLGNGHSGIQISGASNIIGGSGGNEGNLISGNGSDGVAVGGASGIGNTIRRNSITANSGIGIRNLDGGNGELSPPVIISIGTAGVSGTAPPDSTVEIFSDEEDEGRVFEGSVSAGAAGDFLWAGTPAGPWVTATATDAIGNTSQFSAPSSLPIFADGFEDGTVSAWSVSVP